MYGARLSLYFENLPVPELEHSAEPLEAAETAGLCWCLFKLGPLMPKNGGLTNFWTLFPDENATNQAAERHG